MSRAQRSASAKAQPSEANWPRGYGIMSPKHEIGVRRLSASILQNPPRLLKSSSICLPVLVHRVENGNPSALGGAFWPWFRSKINEQGPNPGGSSKGNRRRRCPMPIVRRQNVKASVWLPYASKHLPRTERPCLACPDFGYGLVPHGSSSELMFGLRPTEMLRSGQHSFEYRQVKLAEALDHVSKDECKLPMAR